MFGFGYLIVAAAAVAVVAGRPQVPPRSLELKSMINKTVCAIREDIDEDKNRIPQKIKMLRCAAETDQWCVKNNITHRECCHHSHNRYLMECVEMTDTVLVFNKLTNSTEPFFASVGCTCMITQTTEAISLDSPS